MTDNNELTPPELEPETQDAEREPVDSDTLEADDLPADSALRGTVADEQVLREDFAVADDVADDPLLDVDSFNYRAYAPDLDVPVVPDIDAALAAVATLSDTVAQEEAVEQARIDAAAEREAVRAAPRATLPMPPPLTLRRGHLASIIPALLLVAGGAGLTFAWTSGVIVPFELMAALAGAALLLILLSQWLAFGRWSRGTLFIALLGLSIGGALYADAALRLGHGLALSLAAVGIAFALSGLISRPVDWRLVLPALVFVTAGLVTGLFGNGVIPAQLIEPVVRYWLVVPVALVILWILPLVFRRRVRG